MAYDRDPRGRMDKGVYIPWDAPPGTHAGGSAGQIVYPPGYNSDGTPVGATPGQPTGVGNVAQPSWDQLAQQHGIDPGTGQPVRPDYNPVYDKLTMGTSGPLQQQLSQLNYNRAPLDAYEKFAMGSGPSQYAQTGMNLNALQGRQAMGNAQIQAAGQGAAARSALAARGGLDSGARERIARDQGRNVLHMTQDAQGQENQGNLRLSMNDEQQKTGALGQLPGAENQALQSGFQKAQLGTAANQFDTNQQVAEGQAKNYFDMNTYNQQMKAWAANKEANATENAGKK